MQPQQLSAVPPKVQAMVPGLQETGGPQFDVCVVYLRGASVDSPGSRLLFLPARNVFL